MTQRLQAKLKLEALRNYALRTLSQRSLSVSELRRKLHLKAENPADVEPVVVGAAPLRAAVVEPLRAVVVGEA